MKRTKQESRKRIQLRIRKKIKGTPERPRLSVYRSNKSIYCQVIDDINGLTLASASSIKATGAGIDQAVSVGKEIAQKATAAGVTTVVFDRGGNLYHGRVKALAESAREGGLQF